ncbi:MAG: hypothetical protein WD468_12385 [Pirellulales bacterium]
MDAFAPCPGGLDKKVKFCCPDLVKELDKIERFIEGEQRVAALEYIAKLDAKFQSRACILALKSGIEAELGQEENAQETLRKFLAEHPKNPAALAQSAEIEALRENVRPAVDHLQQALEVCEKTMPGRVYDAIGVLVHQLLRAGHLPAARAHLYLQLRLDPQDENPRQVLLALNRETSLGVWQKDDPRFVEPPAGAPYEAALDRALETGSRGRWRAAAKAIVELIAQYGDVPVFWANLATLRAYLADEGAAGAAWRRFASLDVPLDDAVEAEARAQTLTADTVDTVDIVRTTYPVADFDLLNAQLLSDKRVTRAQVDPRTLGREGEPPPRLVCFLLDRPLPATGVGLSIDDAPNIAGELLLYGRETDREARLEVVGARSELDGARSVLAEVTGTLVGTPSKEEAIGQVPKEERALSWQWRLPDDTPLADRHSLIVAKREQVLEQHWPELPSRFLDGKTPRQAAAEPKFRVALLATILRLEWLGQQQRWTFDFNRLRSLLGLPLPTPIDNAKTDFALLPLVRLARVQPETLTDEQLVTLYARAASTRYDAATRLLGPELIRRPSLDAKVDKAQVYGALALASHDTSQALEQLAKAAEWDLARGQSPAAWYLQELSIRITRMEADGIQRALDKLRGHMTEPGVNTAVYQILAEAGLIDPGQLRGGARAPRGETVNVSAAGTRPAPASSGLWTPDGGAPAAEEKKSSLWLPE